MLRKPKEGNITWIGQQEHGTREIFMKKVVSELRNGQDFEGQGWARKSYSKNNNSLGKDTKIGRASILNVAVNTVWRRHWLLL